MNLLLLFALFVLCNSRRISQTKRNDFSSRRERDIPHGERTSQLDTQIDRFRDTLYISSNEYAKVVAGHTSATADVYTANRLLKSALSWSELAGLLFGKDVTYKIHGSPLRDEALVAYNISDTIASTFGPLAPSAKCFASGDCMRHSLSLTGAPEEASLDNYIQLVQERMHALLIQNHYLLGQYLQYRGELEASVAVQMRGLEIIPAADPLCRAHMLLNMAGNLLHGRDVNDRGVKDAVAIIEEALALDPTMFYAFKPLVAAYRSAKTLDSGGWDKLLARLQKSLKKWKRMLDSNEDASPSSYFSLRALLTDSHHDLRRSDVLWAAYECAESAKKFDLAWGYLQEAHEMEWEQKKQLVPSVGAEKVQTEAIKSSFHAGFWKPQFVSNSTRRPVFIVGIMRTGSTLLETMLQAHPNIKTVGEHSIFNSLLSQFRDELIAAAAKPGATNESMRELYSRWAEHIWVLMMQNAQQADQLGAEMRGVAVNLDGRPASNKTPGEESVIMSVVDKMLLNYRSIGFIHLLFPDAIILNMVRDPMDTMFSTYRKRFDDPLLSWTLSASHILDHYANYLRLMHHWRQVLPRSAVILDVRYEDMVNSPDSVLREVLQRIGLPWDPSIVQFNSQHLHAARRTVLTFSSMQLQDGIHNSTIGTWLKYKNHVRDLFGSVFTSKYLPGLQDSDALPFADAMNWDCDVDFEYAAGSAGSSNAGGSLQSKNKGRGEDKNRSKDRLANKQRLHGDEEEEQEYSQDRIEATPEVRKAPTKTEAKAKTNTAKSSPPKSGAGGKGGNFPPLEFSSILPSEENDDDAADDPLSFSPSRLAEVFSGGGETDLKLKRDSRFYGADCAGVDDGNDDNDDNDYGDDYNPQQSFCPRADGGRLQRKARSSIKALRQRIQAAVDVVEDEESVLPHSRADKKRKNRASGDGEGEGGPVSQPQQEAASKAKSPTKKSKSDPKAAKVVPSPAKSKPEPKPELTAVFFDHCLQIHNIVANAGGVGDGPITRDNAGLWLVSLYSHTLQSLSTRKYDAAIALLDVFLSLFDNPPVTHADTNSQVEQEQEEQEEQRIRLPQTIRLLDVLRALGTAQAMNRDLATSKRTFDRLLSSAARFGNTVDADALDRRSDVLQALGQTELAIRDLEEGITALRTVVESPQGSLQLFSLLVKHAGLVFATGSSHAIRRSYESLQEAQRLLTRLEKAGGRGVGGAVDPQRVADLYRYLGRCEKDLGNIPEALSAFGKALSRAKASGSQPLANDVLHDRALAFMTAADTAAAQKDLDAVLSSEPGRITTWGIQGLMYQNMGECKKCIASFEEVLRLAGPSTRETAPFLLMGVCFRSMGDYSRAASSFAKLKSLGVPSADYRAEVLAFEYLTQDWPIDSYNIDAALSAELKLRLVYSEPGMLGDLVHKQNARIAERNAALRRKGLGQFTTALENSSIFDMYRIQVQEQGGYVPAPGSAAREERESEDAQLAAALRPALARISPLSLVVQSRSPGFLPNTMQHRQFCLSSVHMASVLIAHARALNRGSVSLVPHTASSNILSAGFQPVYDKGEEEEGEEEETKPTRSHLFFWRDFFDLAVRYRHISAPLDNVLWSDGLHIDADSNFVGMTTHITSGHDKVVRYYDQFGKAFELLKRCVLRSGYYTSEKVLVTVSPRGAVAEAVRAAKTLEDIVSALGGGNFYIVTELQSERNPGTTLPGTLFSVIREEGFGYAFSICLPSSPHRFEDFEVEVDHAFARVVTAIQEHEQYKELHRQSEKHTPKMNDSSSVLNVKRAALGLFYYWANFGPLTRGSSATGYAALVAALLSAGLEPTQQLPQGMQLDWEAFYASNADEFYSNVEASLALKPSSFSLEQDDVKQLVEAMTTNRRIKIALNA